jgi:hypothetical protein
LARAEVPYKFQKAQSQRLSETLPSGAFATPWDLSFTAAGSLLVADPGDPEGGRIDEFDATNGFQRKLGEGVLTGGFTRGVATDDGTGDVYVADSNQSEVVVMSSSGVGLSRWTGANTPAKTFGAGCCFVYVAADNSASSSKGDVYVMTNQGGGEVDVLEPQGENKEEGKFARKLESPEGFEFGSEDGLAVDDSSGPTAGDVYVADTGHNVIDRFSPTGEFEEAQQLTGPSSSEPFHEPTAVAVDQASGEVFVVDHLADGNSVVDKFSRTGEFLGRISEAGGGQSFGHPVGVAVQRSGADAGEVYVSDSEKKVVDVFALEVPAAPTIEGEAVSQLTSDSADFGAEVNPRGDVTSYHFEYGVCRSPSSCATSPYEQSVPSPEPSFGSEADFVVHSLGPVHVQGLTAGTTYHYRVIAHNSHGEVPGEERTFITQGAGGALELPDGRGWELVSPPDKRGAVTGQLGEVGVIQAAVGGGAIAYLTNAPTEAAPQGNAAPVQVLSTRGAGGWGSRDIATPHERATGASTGVAPEYRFFSEELSSALVQPFGRFSAQLSGEASEQTPYLHALGGCANECFHPLVTGKAGFANVPAGTSFGEERLCEEENGINGVALSICGPLVEGSTPDLSDVVLRSAAPLTSGAPRNELYEWAGGHLSLLSVLAPNEAGEELPAPSGPLLGDQFGEPKGSARGAVSSDGRRVFWGSGGALYMRDLKKGQTLQLDAGEGKCVEEGKCSSGAGRFQIASSDGSRVYFTDEQRLTKDAGAVAGSPDLYECEIDEGAGGRPACELRDLTPLVAGESANVQGNLLGASEDGGAVYFVADGTLGGVPGATGGTCVNIGENGPQPAGAACNLYALREGGPAKLVAVLSGGDAKEWSMSPEHQPARVSPDGEWLAFMSERSLTGYDNHDAVSARPDAEAYLYSAVAGRVICASCKPTGARPSGVQYGRLESVESEVLPAAREEWETSGWVAALLPHASAFNANESAYQSRYLADSGRLFFNSADALVPQDVNGTGDVYEYEPAGIGGCSSSSTTFTAQAGGCIGLISSGSSAQSSAFLDASSSGGDVFFLSTAKLTSEDVDTRKDVYDAHECTAASPCIPPSAVQPPACITEASCRPSPSPQPGIFGAPSSATFQGPGNPAAAPATPPKPKTAAQIRAEKLTKALKACKKDKKKQKRLACEKQARKKYGAKARAKKPAHKKPAHKANRRAR